MNLDLHMCRHLLLVGRVRKANGPVSVSQFGQGRVIYLFTCILSVVRRAEVRARVDEWANRRTYVRLQVLCT